MMMACHDVFPAFMQERIPLGLIPTSVMNIIKCKNYINCKFLDDEAVSTSCNCHCCCMLFNFYIHIVQLSNETCPNWIKQVQIGTNLSKLDQTCPNRIKLDKTCRNWIKLVQIRSNLLKLDQTCLNWIKHVQIG